MKKNILLIILAITVSFAFTTTKMGNKTIGKIVNGECTLTSSGIIHSKEYGEIPTTLTVTGPCDISLTKMLKDKIAEVRTQFE